MRALISVLSRSFRRGAPDPQSDFYRPATRGNPETSGASSAIVLIVVSLRNVLFISTVAGGGYWLTLQDWSTDGALKTTGADESLLDSRNVSVLDLSWSADGKTFLSRSVGHSIEGSPLVLHRINEIPETPFISSRPISTGAHVAWNAILLPDASGVVIVDESRIVTRIDIESGMRTELVDVSRMNRVPAFAVDSDGSSLAVVFDEEVRLFDPATGVEFLRLAGHDSNIADLVFSDDDRWVVAGHGDGTIRIWNRTTGELVQHLSAHIGPVAAVRFVNGGRHLASAGLQPDATLRLWDMESANLLWQVPADSTAVRALAVSTDGRLAATGGHDNEIVFWNLPARTRIRSINGHTRTIQALWFSPDGTTLTSASSDGTICLWDIDSAELLFSIDVESVFGSLR